MSDLLSRLEVYYDAVPRSSASTETIGPITLFISRSSSWPFYARPSLGATEFSSADVRRVQERQRELGVPEAFEWVAETTPRLLAAAALAGLVVREHPLMVLKLSERSPLPTPPGISLRLIRPEDDLAWAQTVAHVGFGAPGTDIGPEGTAEVYDGRREVSAEARELLRDRLLTGLTFMVGAFLDGELVAVGSHQPVNGVSEVVGVATLPAFRRRGIGAALTSRLVDDALARDVETVFLSAGDDAVARVYERASFRRVGTACIAEGKD